MSLIVSGTFSIRAGAEDEAIAAAGAMAKATREEPGCIAYAFYRDIEDPASFRVFEQWESLDALRAHFETPHMATFRESIPAWAGGPADVKRFEISEEGPVLPD